jgi:iron complex outermembrane receptor protein/vitamin B12 transporter
VVSNRDQLVYQGDYRVTPHLAALIGFHFEDERGSEPGSSYYAPVDRTNYDYLAGVHGDFKNRFFYTLGGSLEHYSLFGTQTSPYAGLSAYVLRPRSGVFSGTRILFNYGDAVREPTLTDQDDSLYHFLANVSGGQTSIQQFHISPLAAPTTRTYEAGLEQTFFSHHLLFRTSYFHNEFGKQIEYVGINLIPALLPNLTAAEQAELKKILIDNLAYELALNSEAFRAQGVETTVEGGIGRNIFLRGGYTYLDAVVQRSFSSDNEALTGGYATTFNGIPLGSTSPLKGARPFRRAPHTGFLTASYNQKRLTASFTSSFASRSDDSDFLGGYDLDGGNSLLLPNRNLDHGYARLDLGVSFELLSWMNLYVKQENLANSSHIAPIGYPSLPYSVRTGLRIEWGGRAPGR